MLVSQISLDCCLNKKACSRRQRRPLQGNRLICKCIVCVRVCVVCVHACVHACAQCTCVHVGLIKDVPSQTSNTKSFFFFFCIISSALKVSTSGDENDPNLLAVKANHARANRYVYTVV